MLFQNKYIGKSSAVKAERENNKFFAPSLADETYDEHPKAVFD